MRPRVLVAVAALLAGSCAPATGPMTSSPAGMPDTAPMASGVRNAPPVKGFAEGQEVFFIHTEASDGQVADRLTRMMGSPVLVVPSLAQVPSSALANVYVFKNGMKGEGPFGFQPDVFDSTPSRTGYSPLRAVHLVAWKDERQARVLRSVEDVRMAEARGEITIERSGAVVNMPMLAWPGGRR